MFVVAIFIFMQYNAFMYFAYRNFLLELMVLGTKSQSQDWHYLDMERGWFKEISSIYMGRPLFSNRTGPNFVASRICMKALLCLLRSSSQRGGSALTSRESIFLHYAGKKLMPRIEVCFRI